MEHLSFRPEVRAGCIRSLKAPCFTPLKMFAVVLLPVVLAACAPRFVHLDGQPFTPIAPALSLGNGWLAIDSCELGPHAVVEIQLETTEPRLRVPEMETLALRVGTRRGWQAGRVRVEEPLCWKRARERRWEGDADRSPVRRESVSSMKEPHCLNVVHAQFDLDRLPVPGDSIAVLHGKRFVHVVWKR